MCGVKSYNKRSKSSLSASTQADNCFPLVYCSVDNTLFEVSPEIRCLCASSHYGNHAAGSKPILKLFIISIKN